MCQEVADVVNVDTIRASILKTEQLERINAELIKNVEWFKTHIPVNQGAKYTMIDLLTNIAITLEEIANDPTYEG